MTAIDPTLLQLFQSLSLVGLVTFLVNIIAPFLEKYTPFANPQASTHDATLRALNLLLNVGLALGIAALMGQLTTGPATLAAIGLGIAQATGSHLLYTSGNRASTASATVSVSPTVAGPSAVSATVTTAAPPDGAS